MEISTDNKTNPALKEEVQSLRSDMADIANTHPMPGRFIFAPHPDRPAMIITDTSTDRSSTVSLYAYSAVRDTLNDLFGE